MTKLLFKADAPADQRLVYGEVYAPDRPDADDDFMTAEEIQTMAHEFMRKGITDQVDINHDNETVPGIVVVESFIARKGDPDFIEGAWVVGVHVNDDATWAAIKKGELNGFSMEAMVQREEQDVTLEMPPVVAGLTSKSEDHTHHFYVNYNENGYFMGGITDYVEGHRHIIKAGTVTEIADGHRHTFSSVDPLHISKE